MIDDMDWLRVFVVGKNKTYKKKEVYSPNWIQFVKYLTINLTKEKD